jgi:hypothetical protein
MRNKMAEKKDNEQQPKRILLSNFVYVDEKGVFRHRWLMNNEIVGVFEWERELEFFAEIYDGDI